MTARAPPRPFSPMRSAFRFPDPSRADPDGLVAVSDEVTPELLVAAYSQGIFPWTSHPVGWFSPDPRAVFPAARVSAPRNLGRLFRRSGLRITCDVAFAATMRGCRDAHRREGAWIDESWVPAYRALHEAGLAHSVEVWRGERQVGGIYGVQLAGMFAGESMFHLEDNASKFALAALAAELAARGVALFDVQVLSAHTRRLGAVEISRRAFLTALAGALALPVAAGRWPSTPRALGPLAAADGAVS